MIRVLIFLLLLAAAALGISWLVNHPGDISLNWQGYNIQTSVAVAAGLVSAIALVLALVFGFLLYLWNVPSRMSQRAKRRRKEKGYAALSRGMIAVGAGDAHLARKSATEASKHLDQEPLTLLLGAQAAQLSGDRAAAEAAFNKLTVDPATKLLGLRGLHIEAQRRGDPAAALHFAEEAHKLAPLSWSAKAVLDHRAAEGQWEHARAVLERQIAAKLIDQPTGERQRAVLETALAQEKEAQAEWEQALVLARKALGRAPDLIPASVATARILARRGELRKAAKTVETAWDRQPHPDLAEVYLNLRPGDSNADRLAKARTLAKIRPTDPESRLIVARAALAARDFTAAREAMAPLIGEDARPTQRMCLIMAELEDRDTGDAGKVREWLARSARAPRDPVWIADGIIASKWAPISPATGRLDAFVWQTPADRLGAPIDADDSWIAHAETAPQLAAPEVPAPPAPPPAAEEAAVATAAAAPEILPPPKAETPVHPNGPASQKVIFPMPAAPDDPGPAEEAEVAENTDRVGFP
ncbi:MAG: heme biosynthesis HemY N-terminal domain-containing protein [Pseudomonadota bacterium]